MVFSIYLNFYRLQGCRSVEEFQCLNRIEEGSYGVVYRARDKTTNEIVALKRLKMEKEKEGFPITSLREINTLLKVKIYFCLKYFQSKVFSVLLLFTLIVMKY
jgi:serine/threonine protein kinase